MHTDIQVLSGIRTHNPPAIGRAMRVHALDRAATVIGRKVLLIIKALLSQLQLALDCVYACLCT
jgi:hypothetical protein